MDDGTPGGRFLDAAIRLLERVRDEESETITAAGGMIADTVADGGGSSPTAPATRPSPHRTSSTAPGVWP